MVQPQWYDRHALPVPHQLTVHTGANCRSALWAFRVGIAYNIADSIFLATMYNHLVWQVHHLLVLAILLPYAIKGRGMMIFVPLHFVAEISNPVMQIAFLSK